MLRFKALNWGMSKIWKEIPKIWNLGETKMTKIPNNSKQCKMLKCINGPSYKRKNKNEFPSDSKVHAKKSIPEDPGEINVNSRMLTV